MNTLLILAQAVRGGDVFASLFAFFFVIALMVGIFFLCRKILLWYWQITDIIDRQERIEAQLHGIYRLLDERLPRQ